MDILNNLQALSKEFNVVEAKTPITFAHLMTQTHTDLAKYHAKKHSQINAKIEREISGSKPHVALTKAASFHAKKLAHHNDMIKHFANSNV